MPATVNTVPVSGTIRHTGGGQQLVLERRLDGHDTFLTGVLHLGGRAVPVRIISLDDVTVLRPAEPGGLPGPDSACSGILHLPHGQRRNPVPADLQEAAAAAHRTLEEIDDAELRYALTFLLESTTVEIRRARIDAIVAALPRLPGAQP